MCSWMSLSNPFFVVIVKQVVLFGSVVVWNQFSICMISIWEKKKKRRDDQNKVVVKEKETDYCAKTKGVSSLSLSISISISPSSS